MTQDHWRWEALAAYNAARAQGVEHSPELDAGMAVEQAAFNAEQIARFEAEWDHIEVIPGGALLGWNDRP